MSYFSSVRLHLCSSLILSFTVVVFIALLGAQVRVEDLFPVWPGGAEASAKWPEQFVFRQADGPDLVIRFPDEEWAGEYRGRTIVYDLHNQVRPVVHLTSIEPLDSGRWRYRYQVCNEASAEDPIESITMMAPISHGPVCIVHRKAEGFRAPCPHGQAIMIHQERSEYGPPFLGFTARDLGMGLSPGECASELDVETDFLPGIGEMLFTPFYTRLDQDRMNWPDRVLGQAFEGVNLSWYGKQFHTVRPAIPSDATLEQRVGHFRRGIAIMHREGSIDSEVAVMRRMTSALDQLEDQQRVPASMITKASEGVDGDPTMAALVQAFRVTFEPWIRQ